MTETVVIRVPPEDKSFNVPAQDKTFRAPART